MFIKLRLIILGRETITALANYSGSRVNNDKARLARLARLIRSSPELCIYDAVESQHIDFLNDPVTLQFSKCVISFLDGTGCITKPYLSNW